MNDFPKSREAIEKYRQVLFAKLSEGLKKWKAKDVFSSLTNGKQLEKALKSIPNVKLEEEVYEKCLVDSKCPLINAMEDIFNIPFKDPKEFEQQVVNKIKSVHKTFDGDRYLAAALLNDRFLKSAQVNKFVIYFF